MEVLTNEDGGFFPEKPYYPLCLANGVDAMLVNITGSGNPWFLAFAGSYMQSVGWFKCDRRSRRDTRLIYGAMLPLLDFTSRAILNGDTAVPRDAEQRFAPRTGTLTTVYSQLDNETLEPMRVRVTTFLTSDHVLVERYEMLEAPRCGVPLRFTVQSPPRHHLNLSRNITYPDRKAIALDPAAGCLRYDFAYEAEGLRGRALSWVDVPLEKGWSLDEEATGEWQCAQGNLQTLPLRAGDTVVRYLAAVDSVDTPGYEEALERLLEDWRAVGFATVRSRHEREWGAYFAASGVAIPDPGLQHLYEVSRYVIKANHHPELGFQPVGILPYLFGGVMFWDASFALAAFLGSGNRQEAFRMVAFLRSLLPEARQRARSLSARGARFEWTMETRAFTAYPHPVLQFHNNSVWAYAIYLCYDYTGDRQFLADAIELMEELLLFMVDRCVVARGDALIVGECEGIDESVTRLKTNDTWTCAVTLKALEAYRCACGVLDRKPAIGQLDGLIEGLGRGLDANVDDAGVLQGFSGGILPHWGCLIFDMFPGHPALRPTLRQMMRNRDADSGLYNFHGVTRYAEKAFPWASFWAARILARAGDPAAGDVLENGARGISGFGSIPERVWYHGERVNEWFSTASAAFVWAVNGMLASVADGQLRILGGMAHRWRDVSFSGIHAGNGLVVSARVSAGVLEELLIVNQMPQAQVLDLCLGDAVVTQRLTLHPGANRVACVG